MAKDETTTETTEAKLPTPAKILEQLVAGEITQEQAKELLDKRQEAIDAKAAAKPKNVEFGWGKKGGAMIRGLRKFPISLFPAEVDVIDQVWEQFKDYVAAGPADTPEETERLVVGKMEDGEFVAVEQPDEDEDETEAEAA